MPNSMGQLNADEMEKQFLEGGYAAIKRQFYREHGHPLPNDDEPMQDAIARAEVDAFYAEVKKTLDQYRDEIAAERAEWKALEARIDALQRGHTPARGKR